MSKIPPCEKCGGRLDGDLACKPCGREYTPLWLRLVQAGKR